MDELEKNQSSNDSEASLDNAPNEDLAALETKKELEELRDMFQKELDNAIKEAEDGGEKEEADEPFIQELDEIEEDSEEEQKEDEISEKDLCLCCGEKRRDTSFGDDYPYCTDCRALMKSNPLNPIGVIALIFTILISGFSLGIAVKNVDDYDTLLSAQSAYSSGYLVDSVNYYQTYFSSKTDSDISMKAVKNTVDAMASLGYYSNANSLVETYFSQAQLKMPWNKKYADIQTEYTLLTKTSDLINTEFSDALNNGDFDYKEEIKKADKLIEENKESGEYDVTFLEYAKYLLMLISDKDSETQLAQLKKIEEIDGGKHPWIYVNYILNAYAKAGDIENAEIYFNKCIDLNRQEMTAYTYYANVYRFGQKIDADKILEIADQAKSACSSSSYPEYYRIYALGYALKGDYESAINNITLCLSNCQPTVSDYNLYALLSLATKDDEGYDEAKSTLEAYGYSLSDNISKFKKGKLTLEQILADKEGDI